MLDLISRGVVVIDVGSYQSHCIGIVSFIVAAIGLKTSLLDLISRIVLALDLLLLQPSGSRRAFEMDPELLVFKFFLNAGAHSR